MGVAEHIELIENISIADIPPFIQKASVGVVPNRRNPFTSINFPQRLLEFGLLKRPVVAPQFPGIMDYFSEEDLCFFEPEDPADLAVKIIGLHTNPQERDRFVANAHAVTTKLEWKQPFLDIVHRMAGLP